MTLYQIGKVITNISRLATSNSFYFLNNLLKNYFTDN